MCAVYVRSWNKSIHRRCSYETAYPRIVLTCIRVRDKGARANTALHIHGIRVHQGGKVTRKLLAFIPGRIEEKKKHFLPLPYLATSICRRWKRFFSDSKSFDRSSSLSTRFGNLARRKGANCTRISRFGECFCCDAWKFLQRVNGSKLQLKG